MVTCGQIKSVAKKVYPSSTHPGWVDLSPPVRFSDGGSGKGPMLAFMLNEETGQVLFVEEENPRAINALLLSDLQGRILQTEITSKLLDELEKLLNMVSDKRSEDGTQTPEAVAARNLLDKFGMERHKS